MLYSGSLEEKVFDIPMHGGDEFVIISGYVGPEPIARLKELPHNVHTKLIFGMYGMSGISSELHKQILVLNKELENVEIYYSTIPVHSKIYFMRNNDGEIKNALVGSANFSVSGLRNDYREVLSDLDEASYGDLSDYYAIIEGNLVHCENADTTKIRQVARSFTFDEQEDELVKDITPETTAGAKHYMSAAACASTNPSRSRMRNSSPCSKQAPMLPRAWVIRIRGLWLCRIPRSSLSLYA